MSSSQEFKKALSFGPLLILCACPPAPMDTETDTKAASTSTHSTSATTSSQPTSGSVSTTDTTEATETGATTAASACGNGQVGSGESCDDGNQVNGDGCNNDCSKSGELVWEYKSGLPNQDEFRAVAVANGSIMAGGRQEVRGNGFDRWYATFSSEGDSVLSITYNGLASFENIHALAAADHGIYAAGAIKTNNQYDIWAAKLNADGKIAWEDALDSGFGEDFAKSASATNDGVIVAGVESVTGGLAQIWVRSYGSDGKILWTHNEPFNDSALYSAGPGVAVFQDVAIVGFYQKSQQGTLEDFLMAIPVGGGTPSWKKTYPMSGSGIIGVARADGDIVVAAQIIPEGIGVRRFDGMAEQKWSSLDCTGSTAESVAVDSQGDVIAIGSGKGNVGDNIRLCKFSADGVLRWGKDIDGGVSDDRGRAVAILTNDYIVAAGHVSTANTATDGWLAVFTP